MIKFLDLIFKKKDYNSVKEGRKLVRKGFFGVGK